jgi:hypothetical protein
MGSEAPVVVYDASVLFPFQTAHLLTFMALRRLVRAHWSADIEREWVERSLEKYGAFRHPYGAPVGLPIVRREESRQDVPRGPDGPP